LSEKIILSKTWKAGRPGEKPPCYEEKEPHTAELGKRTDGELHVAVCSKCGQELHFSTDGTIWEIDPTGWGKLREGEQRPADPRQWVIFEGTT